MDVTIFLFGYIDSLFGCYIFIWEDNMRKEKLKEIDGLIEELKCSSVVRCDCEPNFLKSEVYDCNLNGNVFKREKLVKNNLSGDAIVIFPVTSDNNVVLVAEPRVFTKELVGIGVPTGFVDALEEGSIAAIRELREETGYVTDDVCFLGGFYQDEGSSSAYIRMYLAKNCEKKFEQSLDNDEFVRFFECSYDEFFELIEMGYINGCSTLLCAERVKKYIRL